MRKQAVTHYADDLRGRGRRYVHDSTAERNVERVAAEQVDYGDEDEQNRRFPALLRAEQLGLPKDDDEHDRQRHEWGHAVDHAEEAIRSRGQAEWNRNELKGQVNRREPSHVETKPLGSKPAKAVHAAPCFRVPEEVNLPESKTQRQQNADSRYG